MWARPLLVLLASTFVTGMCFGQASPSKARWLATRPSSTTNDSSVRPASAVSSGQNGAEANRSNLEAIPGTSTARRTHVSQGIRTLPNEQGQVWRDYDISPYTLRVTSTNRPEQAIIDWILRETGYEAWHSEPLGILCASKQRLRVYHTPEMQAVVAAIVDRFVGSYAETRAFGLRVVSLKKPNWCSRVRRVLHPVAVQSQGVRAWLLRKEDAAMLLAELHRRSDYREHSSSHLLIGNGQSQVISTMRPRTYLQDVAAQQGAWLGFQSQLGKVDEGFLLELDPLLSLDGRMVDAVLKCKVNQVEKMLPVMLDLPTESAPGQRAKVEVPQIAQFHFQERFRWPTDQVLLVELGIIPLPVPAEEKTLVPGLALPLPLPTTPPRADLLLFVECKTSIGPGRLETRRSATNTHGRY